MISVTGNSIHLHCIKLYATFNWYNTCFNQMRFVKKEIIQKYRVLSKKLLINILSCCVRWSGARLSQSLPVTTEFETHRIQPY